MGEERREAIAFEVRNCEWSIGSIPLSWKPMESMEKANNEPEILLRTFKNSKKKGVGFLQLKGPLALVASLNPFKSYFRLSRRRD